MGLERSCVSIGLPFSFHDLASCMPELLTELKPICICNLCPILYPALDLKTMLMQATTSQQDLAKPFLLSFLV